MSEKELFSPKNIKAIFIIALMVFILNLGFNLIQIPKYKSSFKLLVVSGQETNDIYTATQTSDYIAGVLGEVVNSSSFINNVIQREHSLEKELGNDVTRQQENWKKMVRVQSGQNKGMITIDVLNANRTKANVYANAILSTLLSKHETYHGAGEKIALKVIDRPAASEKKVQPKVLQNAFLGLIAGLVLGLSYIVLFPKQNIFRNISIDNIKKKNKNPNIDLINSFKVMEKNNSHSSGLGSEDETSQYFA
jgi:capsular polysaccharide biosynthesis protein